MPAKGNCAVRRCIVCGHVFSAPPSSDRVCCSKQCSTAHRSDMHAAGVYDDSISKMRDSRFTNPKMMRGEENFHSKKWIIRDPSGNIYRVKNLLDWLRNHADMLDGTPRQAWDGLSKIKYTMQGKRPKNGAKSWKGWTLIDWGD